jgi:hypothetical protein
MAEHVERNFSLIIAYLLPGFVALVGLGQVSELIRSWLAVSPDTSPTIAGFLFVGLASLALGLTLSGVRWVVIDFSHHRTGVSPPRLDYSKLQENLSAYTLAVEHNYRYYQFYANMFVAIAMLVSCIVIASGGSRLSLTASVGTLVLEVILWLASRDCLNRYYHRVGQILRPDDVSNASLAS